MNKIECISTFADPERNLWAVHITRRRPDGKLQGRLYLKPSKDLLQRLIHIVWKAAGNSFQLIPTLSIIGWQAYRQP